MRPQVYKPTNYYYNPHLENIFNYDVTNSISTERISTPSEVSFPQSSKSSGDLPPEGYLSTKLSSYGVNIVSPRAVSPR